MEVRNTFSYYDILFSASGTFLNSSTKADEIEILQALPGLLILTALLIGLSKYIGYQSLVMYLYQKVCLEIEYVLSEVARNPLDKTSRNTLEEIKVSKKNTKSTKEGVLHLLELREQLLIALERHKKSM
ncbi:hypothetical protein [Maribacter sp. 2-571]|uniref:hypothetical protein n=1 Tax=Maribacter sp. 2-571 TaxID=3417569 RepID=UPI003D353132